MKMGGQNVQKASSSPACTPIPVPDGFTGWLKSTMAARCGVMVIAPRPTSNRPSCSPPSSSSMSVRVYSVGPPELLGDVLPDLDHEPAVPAVGLLVAERGGVVDGDPQRTRFTRVRDGRTNPHRDQEPSSTGRAASARHLPRRPGDLSAPCGGRAPGRERMGTNGRRQRQSPPAVRHT